MPGGAFRPPTNFSLNIPKKQKVFSFPRPPTARAVALKRRVLFVPTRIFPLTDILKKNKQFSFSHGPRLPRGSRPQTPVGFWSPHEFFPSLNAPQKPKSFLLPTAPDCQGSGPQTPGGFPVFPFPSPFPTPQPPLKRRVAFFLLHVSP